MVKQLSVHLERKARHWYRCPVIDLHAVVELRRRQHVPILLNFDKVIVQQVDKVLEAQQWIASTFCHDDAEDLGIDMVNLEL